MRVGDRVMRRPVTIADYDEHCHKSVKMMQGTIVFVHPAGRFHSVAFDTPGGKIIESFQGTDLTIVSDDMQDVETRRSKYAR